MSNLGHDKAYYAERNVHLDTRGGVEIDPTSEWGSYILVTTISPNEGAPEHGRMRPVTVGPHTYIGSGSLLYNCIIGEGAIVAAGTVVRSCEVYPWTMVAGNPAQIIARCPSKRVGAPWTYVDCKWEILG